MDHKYPMLHLRQDKKKKLVNANDKNSHVKQGQWLF